VEIDGTHVFENNGFEVCIVFRVSPQSKFLPCAVQLLDNGNDPHTYGCTINFKPGTICLEALPGSARMLVTMDYCEDTRFRKLGESRLPFGSNIFRSASRPVS
jgi:hypothetical protein